MSSKALLFAMLTSNIALSGCSKFLAATHDGPVYQDPGQRSRGEKIDDRQIETYLTVNLAKADPRLADSNVEINSYNGVVLLTGQLPSRQLREMAGDIAYKIDAVRQVHNQISITSEATLYSSTNDSWIATKVRSRLVTARVIEINRVRVVVENRVVYLMGLLTEAEANAVTEIAATTAGVDKVVRSIELVPDHERAPI